MTTTVPAVSLSVAALSIDCADSAAVADFWGKALGRPVSPGAVAGDTAVDAAGPESGPRMLFHNVSEPKTVKNRIQLALATPNHDEETERLTGLGAAGILLGLRVPDPDSGKPVDLVFAIVNPRRPEGGAQAEFVVVPAASAVRTPKGVSDVEAATVPMNGLTVLQALRRLDLPRGATLGVIGSAGVVGQYAIQLGAHAGLRVIADAKPEDEELVRGFGAHEVIVRSGDPGAAFRAVAPGGVDGLIDAAVIDSDALAPIRDDGALATVRRWNGPTERGIRIEPVLVATDLERDEGLRELAGHLRAGRLTPRAAGTYPIDRASQAHRRLETGGVRGRLVLTF